MNAPRSRPGDWEEYRKIITTWYLRGDTQAEIQSLLGREFGFTVSVKQLEYRLKAWGLRKNITKAEYQYIGEALQKRSREEGKGTDIYLNDVPIPAKKLKRNLPRYRPRTPVPPEPSGVSVGDIAIVTPPGSPSVRPVGISTDAPKDPCRASPPLSPDIREEQPQLQTAEDSHSHRSRRSPTKYRDIQLQKGPLFPCPICDSIFTFKTNLTRHLNNRHGATATSRFRSHGQPKAEIPSELHIPDKRDKREDDGIRDFGGTLKSVDKSRRLDDLETRTSIRPQLCLPFLPLIAIYITMRPPRIKISLNISFCWLVSESWCGGKAVHETTETDFDREPDAPIRLKTPLFYAICRSIRYMSSGWRESKRYHEALESSLVEDFLFNITASEKQLATRRSDEAYIETPVSPPSLTSMEEDSIPPAEYTTFSPIQGGRQELSNSDGWKRSRGRGKSPLSDSASSAKGDTENPHDLRTHKNSDLKSLRDKYACPFAKGDPGNNVPCWTINRQNLSGIKEHLKRYHFRGELPSDVRTAKNWDFIFDWLFPQWGSRRRPSPFIDMLDIFQRAVISSNLEDTSNNPSAIISLPEPGIAFSSDGDFEDYLYGTGIAGFPRRTLKDYFMGHPAFFELDSIDHGLPDPESAIASWIVSAAPPYVSKIVLDDYSASAPSCSDNSELSDIHENLPSAISQLTDELEKTKRELEELRKSTRAELEFLKAECDHWKRQYLEKQMNNR
ncbi:hypothetical protein TWF696_005012 [Orbilia brochopaga]|uniref:C2H2-type domain-containing protein n=1 Tax=Orbilia brochopaga TaxID=3140254 RepID=A0AAV9UZF3_9PEZI